VAIFVKFLLTSFFLGYLGHAGANQQFNTFRITPDTPISFTPKDHTYVLKDPTGSMTPDEVLSRKQAFVLAADMGPIDVDSHYWILQSLRSDFDLRLKTDPD
jgi:hypothetical protein